MAAHRATISISASVLPDDMKAAIGGTVTYDLNDIGDNNKWIYFANNVSTTAQPLMADGVSFLAGDAGDETAVVDVSADDLGFLVLKHSGFQGDGTTVSTDNLYLNTVDGTAASGNAGDLILEPGDIWWGRFVNTDVEAISVDAAGNTIKLLIYAILDDGGVGV